MGWKSDELAAVLRDEDNDDESETVETDETNKSSSTRGMRQVTSLDLIDVNSNTPPDHSMLSFYKSSTVDAVVFLFKYIYIFQKIITFT